MDNLFDLTYAEDITDEKINIFQNNLIHIRNCLGLSRQQLGDMIGVTRQTIHNLECNKSKMTKTFYIAIATVIQLYMINETNIYDKNMFKKMLTQQIFKEKSK